MSYMPNNAPIYLAAFAGALAGLGASGQPIVNPDYSAIMSDAYAQAIDTAWGAAQFTTLDLDEIEEVSETFWASRSPLRSPDSKNPRAYVGIAREVLSLVRAGTAQVVAEGIDPNTGNGGGGSTPKPSWAVKDWYVNPVTGDDGLNGLTPATAVKTVMGGIVSKWGTTSPRLSPGVTTVHLLAPQPLGVEEITLQPVGQSSVFVIDGTQGSTIVGSAALDAVTPKVYGDPGQTLHATSTAFASAQPGDVVTNSTHTSKATIHAVTGLDVVELNQPVTGYEPPPFQFFPNTSLVEVDTWAPTDHVVVTRPATLNLNVLTAIGGTDADPAGDRAIVQVRSVRVLDPSGAPGTSTFAPSYPDGIVQFMDCVFERLCPRNRA